ncbi:MAG TPA: carbohydrate ABC transporter permease [candidate division WOR-3 bacterium]|uniref:Carbohydrate ABC transporter permease n=1 Tax=candidate division WOR-3 bacterium TaxID=2052148 RepID=A0A7V0T4G4_UNCW3|nr:carbohydrate ABC transporter permease [candidate division WOR-3 bacterium]
MARLRARNLPVHFLLILGGVGMVLPFFWMVSTSLKTPLEALRFPPTWVPTVFQWANYAEVFRQIPLLRYMGNTLFITFASLMGVLLTGILAAYAFARFRFPGREATFMLFLALMMIPLPVYLVPSYMILFQLGWIDTYAAMIVPWTVNIFGIFLLRQHFKQLPEDLFDAARMDGCSRLGTLFRIVLPLSKPPIVTITVFNVIGSWNSFFWPLIVTNSDSIRPLQVGLAYFSREQSTNYTLLMAATTMAIIPLIVLFFFAQRQIIQSQARSGLKE